MPGRALAVVIGVFVAVAATVASLPASAAPSPGCVQPSPPGNSQMQLVVDRLTRTTMIHVPPGLVAGTRSALVLALHGYGGTGPRMESYSGFSRVSDRAHFIVVYPSSAGLYWNSTTVNRPAIRHVHCPCRRSTAPPIRSSRTSVPAADPPGTGCLLT